jgi:hypothetical protein
MNNVQDHGQPPQSYLNRDTPAASQTGRRFSLPPLVHDTTSKKNKVVSLHNIAVAAQQQQRTKFQHPGRLIIMCIPCCLCVSTSEVVIVERLGKFDRMLPAGLGIVCCPFEQSAGSVSFRKCLRLFWTMSYSMKLDACIANLLSPPTPPPFS